LPSISGSAQYGNAYLDRLEILYNDPDGIYASVGMQTTSGLGWTAWANSGGSFNNYIVNSAYNYAGLSSAEYQTREFAASLGYHLGMWSPKIGYAYGNNLMYGGAFSNVLVGNASQIPDSGYQQIVAELDLTLDPQTTVFANYGQIWFGNTLQNISYCGANCNQGSVIGNVNGNNQAFYNQSTIAVGLSHTF